MISITISSKRKENKYNSCRFPSRKKNESDAIVKSVFQEANRRQSRILELLSKINYKSGDTTQPTNAEDVIRYGNTIVVEKICDSYIKWGKSDWPESDTPMLIMAWSVEKELRFSCTPNFLIKK